MSSTGSDSDQNIINEALQEAANNPGSTVYLRSDNGPFVINGQIKIGSNTKLTGDLDTVVKVSKKTSQFFIDGVGVFGQLGKAAAKNIEICGFSIDGNCDELPRSFANSGPGDHNAERLIELRGYTNDFGNNIRIHDMRMYDAFSDAIHIYYSESVFCYNNFISNCQHSSIFYVCCFYSAIYNNEIFGITSDCARLDNCQNCKIYKNIFYSYTGDHNNGAYETGQNGLQVGDQGHSHGGGSDKAYHTTNVEVYENIFANCGRNSIWIDAAGKTPSTNLYIHDNKYIGVPVVERDGTPVNGVNIKESSENVSYDNTPSVELSEKVFSSIFDILNMNFVTQAGVNDTIVFPDGINTTPSKASWVVEQHQSSINPSTLVYGSTAGLTKVEFEVNGMKSTHTLMIGERKGLKVVYTNVSAWDGDISHQGDAICLNGIVDSSDIKVKCYTPKGSFEPSLEVTQIETPTSIFSPILKWALYVLFICFVYCVFVIKHTY
ncbi:MAG: hypothetical protein PHF76_10485 [Bacteroidales bacterium]|nr:hypothetical protein [Bacteroidales bacterium]